MPYITRNPFARLVLALALSAPVLGADSPQDPADLEALLNMKVTTVSRKPEPWFDVPSPLSILTQEDIRRSGALTIPDALRYAPGLLVARHIGNGYAISSRGFSSAFGNKIQVLMDGRSLYTPLFSGVFWEVQDTLLEDIDRIEVIRGPGATQWGANSVNGVINIITKSARATQGTLIQGGGGNEEIGFGGVRYGSKAGESTYWRAYAKYRYRDDQKLSNGAGAQDFSSHYQTGFRTDSTFRDVHDLTFQGDFFWNDFGVISRDDGEHKGGNLLGRWTRSFSEESNLQLQLYYDRSDRMVPRQYSEKRNTVDLDFQHRFQLGERNDLIWGANYRVSADETGVGGTYTFDPRERTIDLISGFVQDEISIVPDRFSIMLGSKFEHNDFTGFELQPSARLSLTPGPRQTLWASVSRAVRTPTRLESDVRLSVTPGGPSLLFGNPDFISEELTAYEIGYRVRPLRNLSLDFATFYNVYDDLRTLEPVGLTPAPLVFGNKREGKTYGVETSVRYEAFDWWELSGSYRLLREDLEYVDNSRDFSRGTTEANDPRHAATLQSRLTLPYRIEFDQAVRFVDYLPNPFVPRYAELDLRIAWRPKPGLELSVVGANLLDSSHPEFNTSGVLLNEVQRSVYGKVMWLF